MAQPPSAQALTDAQAAWQGVFAGGPYTGLKMLEYLIAATGPNQGKNRENFLNRPKNLVSAISVIETHDINTLAPTWRGKTGRCTSLAVKVVNSLTDKKVNGKLVYDWCIYDLGRHRIARCRNTGIVIDSSSTIAGGAFVLQEGQWQRFDKTNASWKFKSSESKFERNGNADGPVKTSSTPISAQAAMVQCLREVAESAFDSVPTLFRTMDANHIGRFHGLIVWAPAAHAIRLARNSEDYRAKRFTTIQWAKFKKNKKGENTGELLSEMIGTDEDLERCLHTLQQWVVHYGGPNDNGLTQWAADGLEAFHLELFQTACNAWERPKLIESTE